MTEVNQDKTKLPFHLISRRQFTAGAVTGLLAATSAGGNALAQRKLEDVDVDKLMAPGELPDITLGSADAKVTMVEYASMSCPHCANFHKLVMPKLKEKYIDTGKVRVILREFPLNQVALAVSMLTRCAGDNEKMAGLVEVYFDLQDQWLVRGDIAGKLLEIGKQAGFTEESFNKCLENKELSDKLIKQRERASKEFGINSTPSFFINGKAVQGNVLQFETFASIIDPLLKENS